MEEGRGGVTSSLQPSDLPTRAARAATSAPVTSDLVTRHGVSSPVATQTSDRSQPWSNTNSPSGLTSSCHQNVDPSRSNRKRKQTFSLVRQNQNLRDPPTLPSPDHPHLRTPSDPTVCLLHPSHLLLILHSSLSNSLCSL